DGLRSALRGWLMIPILHLAVAGERERVEEILRTLRLDAVELALSRGKLAEASESARKILADGAERGDEAVVESARRFDDPGFTREQIRVSEGEMTEAAGRV